MPERPYAMRLRYSEAGRQFFFITLCLEGRKAVLSTLEEGAKRPLLSRYGEDREESTNAQGGAASAALKSKSGERG